jgi:soluble lytic murein transglycosylase
MKTLLLITTTALALLTPGWSSAQGRDDDIIVQAREALRSRDKERLASLRDAADAAHHPLAQWVEYWELSNRLRDAQIDEVEAFYTRWHDTYVEDRLRNDWLLELGRRHDWAAFARDMPRFRMNDDREVTCYHLLTRFLAGEDVLAEARDAWLAQRHVDDGCELLASTLHDAGKFKDADLWDAVRQDAEYGRVRAARAAAALIGPDVGRDVATLFANPTRFLKKRQRNHELTLLAVMRVAAADPDDAAKQMLRGQQRRLNKSQQMLAWAVIARQAAFKLQPEAMDYYARAWKLVRAGSEPEWNDDLLAWQVRAALRAPSNERGRWALVERAIAAMSADEQRDPAWVYWKAQALQARAAKGAKGDAQRAAAQVLLESIAQQMNFYGMLASEELARPFTLPPPPAPLTAPVREAVRNTPGFTRSLQLFALGLRSEAVREWNFTLRGLSDRDLLAAAALACEHEIWDRCINTSDRTHDEIDMAQRIPTPFHDAVLAKTKEIGLDPAFVYGLIRQESRFVMDARSGVGASGLMQIMPGTAKWTAKKIGIEFRPEMITDRETNLHLGANYLKLVLDAFDGSPPLAAAAYNAGPNRSRRWRDGPLLDPVVWIENIPFGETRDYVKKVLSNSVYYAAVLNTRVPSLKTQLGPDIGPPGPNQDSSEREIP